MEGVTKPPPRRDHQLPASTCPATARSNASRSAPMRVSSVNFYSSPKSHTDMFQKQENYPDCKHLWCGRRGRGATTGRRAVNSRNMLKQCVIDIRAALPPSTVNGFYSQI